MPDILSRRDRRPLQREAQRRRGRRNRNLERPYALTLCAPDRQRNIGASTIPNFDRKRVRVRFFDLSPVDADDKVIPGLNWYVVVFVAEDLKAEGPVGVSGGLRRGVGVEAGYEAVEGAEHGW